MKGHPTIYLLAAALTAVCFGTSAAQAAAPACVLSAPEISKKIHGESTKKINEWLYANNGTEISKLASCVVTGEKHWLDIAKTLLTVSPEDGDDDLSMALASALDVNAEDVLAEPWPFSLDLICHVSDDVDTYGLSIRSLDFRIGKVEEVKNPALQSKVQECVESLEANKKWMARYYRADDDQVPPVPAPWHRSAAALRKYDLSPAAAPAANLRNGELVTWHLER